MLLVAFRGVLESVFTRNFVSPTLHTDGGPWTLVRSSPCAKMHSCPSCPLVAVVLPAENIYRLLKALSDKLPGLV